MSSSERVCDIWSLYEPHRTSANLAGTDIILGMEMGEETATSLGVNYKQTRLLAFIASRLLTDVVVSFTGVIGSVSLIVPHVTNRHGSGKTTLMKCINKILTPQEESIFLEENNINNLFKKISPVAKNKLKRKETFIRSFLFYSLNHPHILNQKVVRTYEFPKSLVFISTGTPCICISLLYFLRIDAPLCFTNYKVY